MTRWACQLNRYPQHVFTEHATALPPCQHAQIRVAHTAPTQPRALLRRPHIIGHDQGWPKQSTAFARRGSDLADEAPGVGAAGSQEHVAGGKVPVHAALLVQVGHALRDLQAAGDHRHYVRAGGAVVGVLGEQPAAIVRILLVQVLTGEALAMVSVDTRRDTAAL